ncbi:hypothetical protein Pa4123_46650 [Phytohabitans aurantiacus]|uniref:Uncharacterized protein n=1 Tax=Phytohabitans aurantiacus TaxID=3016789 RepID=A0ABQ5R0C3_9ACTN|nr:hypothetical protein Pa4123_46650 [Phytohabitans aurantiacus]
MDALAEGEDPAARSAAGKLRRLIQAAVLDWRGALEGTRTRGFRSFWPTAAMRAPVSGQVSSAARVVT